MVAIMTNPKDKKNNNRKKTQETNKTSSLIPSGNEPDNNDKDEKTINWTQILVAVIGLTGAIAVAFIGRLPINQQDVEDKPTQTLVVATITSTAPLTTSPTETQLVLTPTLLGYYEDFSQGSNLLPVGTPSSYSFGTEKKYLSDDKYYWEIQAVENSIYENFVNQNQDDNFEFEVSFNKVNASDSRDDYGVRFRNGSNASYTFYINNNGEYGFKKWVSVEGKIRPLVERTQYPLINKDGSNILRVVAQGESMHLYINNNLVERVIDKASPGGKFSLWAWLKYPNDTLKVEIKSLRIIPLGSSSALDVWATKLEDVKTAEIQLSDVDDIMKVYVNGQELAPARYGDFPAWISILDYLRNGDNKIEISISNNNAGQACSGTLRLKLNGIVNSDYQRFWRKPDAPANTECFRETIVLPLE
jgi:hypothetical protein